MNDHETEFGDVRSMLGRVLVDAFPGGSRVICDPPPTDTDEDWCIFVDCPVWTVFDLLEGASDCGDYNGPDLSVSENRDFAAVRIDNLNILVFTDYAEFVAVRAATDIAKFKNMLSKKDRYEFFAAIRKLVKKY